MVVEVNERPLNFDVQFDPDAHAVIVKKPTDDRKHKDAANKNVLVLDHDSFRNTLNYQAAWRGRLRIGQIGSSGVCFVSLGGFRGLDILLVDGCLLSVVRTKQLRIDFVAEVVGDDLEEDKFLVRLLKHLHVGRQLD